ncbi:efflux RND transporter periplasmic adaptor subunit [Alteromonas lipolytica]|uniref:Multidrug resistance protein MdtA-like barrel-sandwich hybrid domain-containing protein n=1 Tax=Alteromonas lipolytica TaxID=1856405 RepID=A0A1E8FD47_9ALTE|nr:efflux RND transporter periplasmic adaptor subunit [Alteromonas lipolytica]OFI33413.1 hypothetical protein BFC17_03905 [Alteromonas lipolytica]GGF59919.1 hypothetical protein GCM10011338_10190 [Alteromonas lipolytica]
MTPTKKRILGTALAAGILSITIMSVFGQAAPTGPAPKAGGSQPPVIAGRAPKPEASAARVGVVDVSAGTHQAVVSGYGEVTSRFVLSLTSQVSGEVMRLADHFETGARFRKGEVMAYLNDTVYQQAVAAARVRVEEARVALEEERLQGLQARQEWERSGLDGEPTSALVLREPYLKAAQAALDDAKAQLSSAERDLTLTQIVAPFDAVVVSRDVQPGSYIQAGTAIANLYSVSEAEIAIPLSAAQWRNLPENQQSGLNVAITDMDGLNHWRGTVVRIEQHLDTGSRQRAAIVQVQQPLDQPVPLYFGTYVTAQIAGKTWNNIWQIPASAVSQKQEVWYVDADNALSKATPDILFQDKDYAYIQPVNGMTAAEIVARPLNSYLVGTKVRHQIQAHSQTSSQAQGVQ